MQKLPLFISQDVLITRMHSSRMRTARSSSHHGGGRGEGLNTPWSRHPPEQAPPLAAGTPWSRHPPGQIPLNFPLGVALKTCKACWDTPWIPAARHAGIPPARHVGIVPPLPPWTEFLTHASENITLPQTSFAGGNNKSSRFRRGTNLLFWSFFPGNCMNLKKMDLERVSKPSIPVRSATE